MKDIYKAFIFFRLMESPGLRMVLYIFLFLGFSFVGWMFWVGGEDEQKLLNSEGQMTLSKDAESGRYIYDLSKDTGYRSKSFIATVFKQEFIVKGSQASVINLQGNIYSDLLNPECLTNIQKELNADSSKKLDILVTSLCGQEIVSGYSFLGKKGTVYPDMASIVEVCKVTGDCAECLIIEGQDSPVGACEAKPYLFKDGSSRVFNSGGERINENIKLISKLPWVLSQK